MQCKLSALRISHPKIYSPCQLKFSNTSLAAKPTNLQSLKYFSTSKPFIANTQNITHIVRASHVLRGRFNENQRRWQSGKWSNLKERVKKAWKTEVDPAKVENKIWEASRFSATAIRIGLGALIAAFLLLVAVLGPDLFKLIEGVELQEEQPKDILERMKQNKKYQNAPIQKMTKVWEEIQAVFATIFALVGLAVGLAFLQARNQVLSVGLLKDGKLRFVVFRPFLIPAQIDFAPAELRLMKSPLPWYKIKAGNDFYKLDSDGIIYQRAPFEALVIKGKAQTGIFVEELEKQAAIKKK